MITQATSAVCHPMNASEYHQDKSAWSKSMLMDFRERRSTCYARHILGTAPPDKATRQMDLGDLAHAALLEPHRLKTDYVAIPKDLLASNGALSTKAAKDFKASNEAQGITVLKADEFSAVEQMVKSVRAKIGRWLDVPAKIEHALYWEDDLTGIRCKCRPDFLVVKPTSCVVLDVKTTADASPFEFQKRVEQHGYWLQDAHYSAGVKAVFGRDPLFLFVVVETVWPFQCAVYELSTPDKANARDVRTQLLIDVGACQESGDWDDDWANQITTLNLRQWAITTGR